MKNRIIYSIIFLSVGLLIRKFKNLESDEFGNLNYLISSGSLNVIPIHLRFGDLGFKFPDLVQASQKQLNYEIEHLFPAPLKIDLIDELSKKSGESNKSISESQYIVELVLGEENAILLHEKEFKVTLFYTLDSIHSNDLPYLITQTIIHHLLVAELFTAQNGVLESEKLVLSFICDRKLKSITDIKHRLEEAIEPYISKLNTLYVIEIEISFNETNERPASHFDNSVEIVLPYTQINSSETTTESKSFTELLRLNQLNEAKEKFIELFGAKIEGKLGISPNPSNNLDIRLVSVTRFKTSKAIRKIVNYLNTNPHKSETSQLVQKDMSLLVKDIMRSPSGDWTRFLARAENILSYTS